jgi:hypothetical protein
MDPRFFDPLNLKNNSRTVAAGGPCNWGSDDDWAEIRQVTITQGTVVGSCGTASTRVYKGQHSEWWLNASSSSQFTSGQSAQTSAVATVRRTNNTTYDVPWSVTVQLH